MLQLKKLNASNRAEWLVEKRYTFGTGTENNFQVSGTDILEIHAGLEVSGDDVRLFNLGGGGSVCVNGQVLEKNQALKAGDEFSVGDSKFKIEDPKQNRKAGVKPAPQNEGWTLKALNTALANKSFALSGSQSIGRSKECDICLNVVHLSRRHAQITVKENYLQVDDLNSSNGTYLNGRKVDSAHARAGDEVSFDTLKFTILGPSSSLEKTQVRQANIDSDATTMRPMIKESDLIEEGKKVTEKRKAREKVSSQPLTTPSEEQLKPQTQSKTGLVLFAGILVAIAAAAAYVFLA